MDLPAPEVTVDPSVAEGARRAEQLEQLEEQIVRTLHAAVHLRELCWTRDGSLNDRLLDTMFAHLPELRKLEITGNSRLWSPNLLAARLPPFRAGVVDADTEGATDVGCE
ncbi:hypothetical protein [uncultured Bradyrhizobium sp.]|uniref:hypothetical protein n=1 Tax=uncultured Bradyrhizobium sp. TaxID=199684 RepID=UPI0026240C6F|nr:hypothetical protein [uncultured Bradyrhizobium sp.]